LPAALLAVVALGFFANMTFINLSRTVLITIPVIVAIDSFTYCRGVAWSVRSAYWPYWAPLPGPHRRSRVRRQ
jgi:hypothetical protein